MTKFLTAKEKAEELGVTLSGLRKTRHLYKHIQKGSRKFLYLPEELKEVVRPNQPGAPLGPPKSRNNRQRNVPIGQENYHKAPGGSGNSLQSLNQLRAKIAFEGKIPKDQREYVDEALEEFHVNKSKEIVEAKRIKLAQEVDRETEKIQEAHYRSRLSGIYNCSDHGRKYPYTATIHYDNKEKMFGPSRDALFSDYVRRKRKVDTTIYLTGKPGVTGYGEEPGEEDNRPATYYDDKDNFIR